MREGKGYGNFKALNSRTIRVCGVKGASLGKRPKRFGSHENTDGSWLGLESSIYLADARFSLTCWSFSLDPDNRAIERHKT